MTLIKSISGIRGTIGGKLSEGLNPVNCAQYVAAYGSWILKNSQQDRKKVVIGRDARVSGDMFLNIAKNVLTGLGLDVIDTGPVPTPTVEMAVTGENADGGIIITASHNPKEWNALKLLNNRGEFVSEADGQEILLFAEGGQFEFAKVSHLGKISFKKNWISKHIERIIHLPYVDVNAIKEKKFRVVIDCVNSVGGLALPPLLEALGVAETVKLNCTPDGNFTHNPEPLPENLTEISQCVTRHKAHVGFAVDPDADRLAIICDNGSMFGEEYTLVAVADYILQNKKGSTVSNLSSTRALRDVTEKYNCKYFASAVGEVHVVSEMKRHHAVIGGEGNGGVIVPDLHYGRDALAGIAIFLTHLAKSGKTCSVLRNDYPNYYMAKNKIPLSEEINIEKIFSFLENKYKKQPINKTDGLKVEFDKDWVHLRKSNTEPIIRIYAESNSMTTAENLAGKIIGDIKETIRG